MNISWFFLTLLEKLQLWLYGYQCNSFPTSTIRGSCVIDFSLNIKHILQLSINEMYPFNIFATNIWSWIGINRILHLASSLSFLDSFEYHIRIETAPLGMQVFPVYIWKKNKWKIESFHYISTFVKCESHAHWSRWRQHHLYAKPKDTIVKMVLLLHRGVNPEILWIHSCINWVLNVYKK